MKRVINLSFGVMSFCVLATSFSMGFPEVNKRGSTIFPSKIRRVESEGRDKTLLMSKSISTIPDSSPGDNNAGKSMEYKHLNVPLGKRLLEKRQGRFLLGNLCNLGSYLNNPSRPLDATSFAFIPLCAILFAPFYQNAGGIVL